MQKDEFIMPEELTGEKIRLVRRHRKYSREMFELIDRSRDFLREFLYWVDATKSEKDVDDAMDMFVRQWEDKTAFDFVALEKAGGKVVGAGGVHDVDFKNRSANFGYLLDQGQTGKGYASELVKLVEGCLFAGGFHRLVIEADVRNLASQRVAERAGYVYEGTLRDVVLAYDGYRSHKLYSKLQKK